MASTYRVLVFGKTDCEKCKALNRRLDKWLKEHPDADIEKAYMSLDTEEGLIAFCESECVNPQRIPAMLIQQYDGQTGRYRPVTRPEPGAPDAVLGPCALYQYVGLQTDYTERGRGVVSPEMIGHVLEIGRN